MAVLTQGMLVIIIKELPLRLLQENWKQRYSEAASFPCCLHGIICCQQFLGAGFLPHEKNAKILHIPSLPEKKQKTTGLFQMNSIYTLKHTYAHTLSHTHSHRHTHSLQRRLVRNALTISSSTILVSLFLFYIKIVIDFSR